MVIMVFFSMINKDFWNEFIGRGFIIFDCKVEDIYNRNSMG